MDRVSQLVQIQATALKLFKKKNADYGDAFAKYGTIGVLVRIGDKINRAVSVTKNGIQLVDDESLRDTLLDLHNYAAMGLMVSTCHASIKDGRICFCSACCCVRCGHRMEDCRCNCHSC